MLLIYLIPPKRAQNNRNRKILSYKQTEELKEYQGTFPFIISFIDGRGNSWTNGIFTELIKYE